MRKLLSILLGFILLSSVAYGQVVGPIFTDFTLFDGSIGANNAFNLQSLYQIIQVTAGGGFSGSTYHVQVSTDGTNWGNDDCYTVDGITQKIANGWLNVAGVWRCNVSGANWVRIVKQSGTTNTVKITASASTIGNTTPVGDVGSLQPVPPNPNVTLYDNSFTPTANSPVRVAGTQMMMLTASGTFSGATFGVMTSNDGVNFSPTDCYSLDTNTTYTSTNWLTAAGLFRCNISGSSWLMAKLASGTPGTVKIVAQTSQIGFAKPPGAGLVAGTLPFTNITGVASDAQIPDLNTLSTGLTATRCVQTDGSGLLSVSAGVCSTGGSVTSVALALPSQFSISGSPVTTTGTLTGSWNTQTAHFGLLGPTTGSPDVPTFRALVLSDLPATFLQDPSGNGFVDRTSSGVTSARTLTGTNGNITVTNGGGGGNPVFDLGTTAVQTDQGNVFSTGDQDFSAAASLKVPVATGAAPTVSGRIAYDSTANKVKVGVNGSSLIVATSGDLAAYQPLATNLTSASALVGSANGYWYFTSFGNVAIATIPDCIASGGNVLHKSGGSWTCDAGFTSSLSGATNNQALFATGATSFASSPDLTHSGGNVAVTGDLTVNNVGTDSANLDSTAYSGHGHIAVTLPYVGGAANILLSTGALTTGHVFTVGANGQAIDGGAVGTGTWTDSSTNTGSNKTLIDALAGGGAGNVIKSQGFWSFDGGSLTADGTNCQDPVKVTINSGPTQYAILCATPNSAVFDAVVIDLKQAVATIKVRLKANDSISTKTLDGTFKAQCRASGTAPSSTWGTPIAVSITLTTANNTYEGLTAAITPNGTCSANSDLYIRYNATGGSNSATTRILGLGAEQQS